MKDFLEKKTQNEKQTPLHFAVKSGSEAIAECLITELEVSKDELDHLNRTALFIAAECSKAEFSIIFNTKKSLKI